MPGQRFYFKNSEVNQYSEPNQRLRFNNNGEVNQSCERSQRFYFKSS